MKYISILFFVILLYSSCNHRQIQASSDQNLITEKEHNAKKSKRNQYKKRWDQYLKEGEIKIKGGHSFLDSKNQKGEYIKRIFFPDKNLMTAEIRFKDKEFTIKSGYAKYWSDNGEIIKEGLWKENKKDGLWKYYTNGTLSKEVDFENENGNEVEKDEIHYFADKKPQFKGCEQIVALEEQNQCETKKMLEFVFSHIKYPADARENGIEGTSIVRFIIDSNGKVQNPVIIKEVSQSISNECLRGIRSLPDWHPAILNNKKVSVFFYMPLKFRTR